MLTSIIYICWCLYVSSFPYCTITLGSNNVCICGSLGTQAYLYVQQQVCQHISPIMHWTWSALHHIYHVKTYFMCKHMTFIFQRLSVFHERQTYMWMTSILIVLRTQHWKIVKAQYHLQPCDIYQYGRLILIYTSVIPIGHVRISTTKGEWLI